MKLNGLQSIFEFVCGQMFRFESAETNARQFLINFAGKKYIFKSKCLHFIDVSEEIISMHCQKHICIYVIQLINFESLWEKSVLFVRRINE